MPCQADRGIALRTGWVPASIEDLAGAPAWMAANHWSDQRLIAELGRALAA